MNWLRPLFRRARVEREMDAEMRDHCERLAADLIAQGVPPAEARRQARMEFGGLEQVKEAARDARLLAFADAAWRHLRYAVRSLAHTPAFTVVAVTTLALGIGANTAMFSLFDQLLLRNLPVHDPQSLVAFRSPGVNPGMDRNSGLKMSFSYPKYLDFRDRSTAFASVAAQFSTPGSLTYAGASERVDVELVTGNYFETLGIRPAIGRLLTPADDRTPMGHPVAVLSYPYWLNRFGGDPAIVGRTVRLNGLPITVIGVSASGFHGVNRGTTRDLRVPMMMKDLLTPTWRGLDRRDWAWLQIFARLNPGLSLPQAEASANVLYSRILRDEGNLLAGPWAAQRDEFFKRRLSLLPAAGGILAAAEHARPMMRALMGMVGVVLLIACVNIASLLIGRTAARRRELGMRMALGAGRTAVIRQLLLENLILAAAGGGAGLLLARMIAGPAARLLSGPEGAAAFSTAPDGRVLLFTLGVTLLTALVSGIVPALQGRKVDVAVALRSNVAGSAPVFFRKALVVAQVSLCVWLLLAAGLFARSLARLRAVDPGFRAAGALTFRIDPALSGYPSNSVLDLYSRVEQRLTALPGVSAASLSDAALLRGGINIMRIEIEGYRPARGRGTDAVQLGITPGYLRSLGIQVAAGRDFAPTDWSNPAVALVNQTFVRRYFPEQNPLGRHIRNLFGGRSLEIVGVVRDQRFVDLRESSEPFYYILNSWPGGATFYVRTTGRPEALLPAMRKVLDEVAPGVPVVDVRTLRDQVDRALGPERRSAALAGIFAVLAVFLAAIGLYGVMSFTVTRRTREIGIRMALGARPASVLRMVLGEAGALIAMGLALGLPTGLWLTRLVRSQLYEVQPTDAAALAGAVLVVATVSLLAGFLPARRATVIDPMLALRWE